jgi:hypothetical protein
MQGSMAGNRQDDPEEKSPASATLLRRGMREAKAPDLQQLIEQALHFIGFTFLP